MIPDLNNSIAIINSVVHEEELLSEPQPAHRLTQDWFMRRFIHGQFAYLDKAGDLYCGMIEWIEVEVTTLTIYFVWSKVLVKGSSKWQNDKIQYLEFNAQGYWGFWKEPGYLKLCLPKLPGNPNRQADRVALFLPKGQEMIPGVITKTPNKGAP